MPDTLPLSDLLPLAVDRKDRTTKRYFDHETALMRDIQAVGVRNPLKVVKDGTKWRIVCGMTRYLAAGRAGLSEVPVSVLEGAITPTRLLIEELTDNNMTEGFGILALAGLFIELMKLNDWTQGELCANVPAAKPATVSKALAIFGGLATALKDKLSSGDIGPRLAYCLARLPQEQQLEAWQKVEHMKVDRAEGHIASMLGKKPKQKVQAVKVSVTGLSLVFTVGDVSKARGLVEGVVAALSKLEKSGFPLPNLPGLLKPAS